MNPLFPGFKSELIEVNGVKIMARKGGSGQPLLLLHGHPQTHAIWHRVAQQLAESHTVVMTDLRGYGDSSKPQGSHDHLNYSKRVMALDQIEVMRQFGFAQFDVLAHDRGARVAHRLALDHPKAVKRLVLLDIAPTLAMYEKTSNQFARSYWHWFFLIQPAPLPERLIEADPAAYVRDVLGRRSAGLAPFDPRALAEYVRCLELPGTPHGLCEDYRASASIDLVHDQLDIDKKNFLQQALLVLWGEHGVVNQCFEPLKEWSKLAVNVKGHALPCGHYIPEEAPELLLNQVQSFLE
ncbi:MAG: alpha/beta hydrolase [Betaproteobacteria bacterium]|jgi:haloacetate dehalogenase